MCFPFQKSTSSTCQLISESSWRLVSSLGPSLSRSLCLRTVSSVGMCDGGQGLSTHIRPRAPLIPIIHKFSQRDLYPPSALQCLLSLPPTSLWLLGRNEMSQCIRTQTHSMSDGDDSCLSPLLLILLHLSLTFFPCFTFSCPSFVCF